MKKHVFTILLAGAILFIAGCSQKQEAPAKTAQAYQSEHIVTHKNEANKMALRPALTEKQNDFTKPYKYTSKKEFKMLPLDSIGRSQGSHIQLSESQTPKVKRSSYLTVKPSGWRNFKLITTKNGKPYTTWLFNRGHLVGYQFCGLNQAPQNMITQTEYVNQGSLTGMDDKNIHGQLFYENALRKWLIHNPTKKLDYSVVPEYHGKELVPRKVLLTYVGLTKSGKKVPINLHSSLEKYYTNGQTSVTLNNDSPQAKIDYQNNLKTEVFDQNGKPLTHYTQRQQNSDYRDYGKGDARNYGHHNWHHFSHHKFMHHFKKHRLY